MSNIKNGMILGGLIFLLYFATLFAGLLKVDAQYLYLIICFMCFLYKTIVYSKRWELIPPILCIFILANYLFHIKAYFAPFCTLLILAMYYFDNKKNIQYGIIFTAFIFNLSFVSNTGISDVSYDFASCYNYMEYILENKFMFFKENPLLTRPSYSSYHPILQFFIGAFVLNIGDIITNNRSIANEALQVISCSYMLIYYIITNKIIDYFKFNKITHLVILAFVCFFPTYNAIAGFINNDTLLLPLQALVIYFSLSYYKSGGMKNVFYIILFNALAQLTKLSSILVLGVVGIVMFLRLINNKNKQTVNEIIYLSLGIIIGCLIWPMYQYFVLGLEFGFVPPQSHLSLEKYSLFDKYAPHKAIFYDRIFYEDFGINLWETLTKTALFGQWNFSYRAKSVMWSIYTLIVLYKMIIILNISGFIFLCIKQYKNINFWFVFCLIIPLFLGMIAFVVKHPYMCNQDFRYIAILPLPIAIISGLLMQNLNKKINITINVLYCLFSFCSCFVWWFVSW